jgi:molybdopterin synthase sulfur carrier subunit
MKGHTLMPVTIRIPGALRPWTDNQRKVELESSSVSDAVQKLCATYPAVGERVLDDDGQPRRFVNLYVNGEDVRLLSGTDTLLKDGDELIIAPAVAGG